MRRVVISTIGTSLLTNQINRTEPNEKDWYTRLRDTANYELEKIPEPVQEIIKVLQARSQQVLDKSSIQDIRLASAELNGIYGLYQEQLAQAQQDIHYLIATDTAQGQATAEIVQSYLQSKGIAQTSIYCPSRLSTASTELFSTGIDDLIVWLREQIVPLREQYRVCFNLVGSFKSLQGYMNSIGMFYADEIIYIFEGAGSQLITIPRLPIKIDESAIAPHAMQLALIKAGHESAIAQVTEIPEAMLWEIDGKKIFSTWGELIWEEVKLELLSQDLLAFPHLVYTDAFKADYKQVKDAKERLKLQETLAKVAVMLDRSGGDPVPLKQDGGLQYDKYVNQNRIDHFRVTQGLRVSCESENGQLVLRRYGKEPDVNRKP
jgi:putative CRISPR-associated protein (TIGR02619 family)